MTTYINSLKCKSVNTKYGEILKLNFNVEKFYQECLKHQNDKGYINIDLTKKQSPSKYGETHNCVLNEWKKPEEIKPEAEDNQDLPF